MFQNLFPLMVALPLVAAQNVSNATLTPSSVLQNTSTSPTLNALSLATSLLGLAGPIAPPSLNASPSASPSAFSPSPANTSPPSSSSATSSLSLFMAAVVSTPTTNCTSIGASCNVFSLLLNTCTADTCACTSDITLAAEVCAQCLATQDAVSTYNAYLTACVAEGYVEDPGETMTVTIGTQVVTLTGGSDGSALGSSPTTNKTVMGGPTNTPPSQPSISKTSSSSSASGSSDSSSSASTSNTSILNSPTVTVAAVKISPSATSNSSASTPSASSTANSPLLAIVAPINGSSSSSASNVLPTLSPSATLADGMLIVGGSSASTSSSISISSFSSINGTSTSSTAPAPSVVEDTDETDDTDDTDDTSDLQTSISTLPGGDLTTFTFSYTSYGEATIPLPSPSAAESVPSSGISNGGMLNTSALIAAQTFFESTVVDSCEDGCRNWASLAKSCSDDNCICNDQTMTSAANCSACIASTGNNEGPTPQTAAYTAFVTNCTIEVPGLNPTGDPVVASPDDVGVSTSALGDNGGSSTPSAAEAGVAGTTVIASPGAGTVRTSSRKWFELVIGGTVAVMLGAI